MDFIYGKRRFYGLLDAFAQSVILCVFIICGDNYGKLVTSDTAGIVLIPNTVLNALCYCNQQFIAYIMTIGIVNYLKPQICVDLIELFLTPVDIFCRLIGFERPLQPTGNRLKSGY